MCSRMGYDTMGVKKWSMYTYACLAQSFTDHMALVSAEKRSCD